MKKILLFLLLQAAVVYAYAQDPPYPVAPAPPQNIVAAEYFIDIDPGLGSGVPIPITSGVNITNSSVAINTAGLAGGVHRLAVRTRSNEGKWSIAVLKEFVVDLDPAYPAASPIQNITAAEYFIDTDPGPGNGTGIPVTAGSDISNLLASINIAGLPAGVHKLCLRTLSAEGRWSLTNIKDFTVDSDPPYPTVPAAQNIVVAEYFIDTDPGFGNGTSISITPGTDINDLITAVNTSGLSDGMHRLCIRTLGANGSWSLTSIKDFAVDSDPAYPTVPAAQNIVSAEYFVDTDPGFGNGIAISLTPGTDINNMITSVNTTGLANGIHHLYLRVLSAEGRWSLTNDKYFEVNDDPAYPTVPAAQNIVSAEYFVDTDPGFGNGTAIPITPGTDINNMIVSVNTTRLANGIHHLYLRVLSAEGRWSLTNDKDFEVNDDPAYPAAPATPQNIVAAEYFIDTDPGLGAGIPVSVTPGTDISNISVSVNTAGLSNGSHHLFLRTKNQEGKWSITNYAVFFTDMLNITPDTIAFGNVPTGVTVERNLVIKNNSASDQTISAVDIGTDFSTDAVLPITINGGQSDTIKVRFTPSGVVAYLDSVELTTTSGKYTSVLTGNGIAQTYSWIISPINGHNYGNVVLNNSASYTFVIYNKSNVPVALSNVSSGNGAFVPTFTPGTVIPANNGSLSLPVVFTPTTVGQFSAQLEITSSTPGVDPATVVVSGNGYTPGTAPVLEYVPEGVYGGVSGVSPAAGPTGTFTYRILYKSAGNKAPMAGYPKVSVDLNGNQTFNDLNEGVFTMVKEGTGTDYITGVVYSYTFTHDNNTNNAGYKFDVTDEDGNVATSGVAYKSGPVVTSDILDLRIFANDISFSQANPQPGQTFTMTARIHNSTAVPATNVPLRFYRDTILIGTAVLPSVPANGSNTINYTLNFEDEGFYPIKVWIDSSQTLGESNVLNNYAIRPVTVGSPQLPGGITATTTALRQECPQLRVLISGRAEYYGTGTNTVVAGAEVTINTGTQTFKTTTDANGNYSILVTGVTCGSGNFAYAVTVTDFTFTSAPASNSIPMPCPAPNACTPPVPQPNMGGVSIGTGSGPCSNIVGQTSNFDFKIKIRERDLNNMWSPFDEVLGGTLKVYINGEEIESRQYGSGLAPGEEITFLMPWQVPEITDQLIIKAVFVYTYAEYEQIPNTATIRPHYITYTIERTVTITPQPNLPDLTIQGFAQTGYTSFRFDAINQKCVTAGSHVVKVFDGETLIKTDTISSLAGGTGRVINYSDPSLTPGVHTIKVIIDADEEVAETDETNNEFTFTITVPAPDLSITDVKASPTLMNSGTTTRFTAAIKNTGKATESFNVRFAVNGVQIGAKKSIGSMGEKSVLTVSSDLYTVTGNTNTCGDVLEVFVDSDNDVSESNEGNNIKTVPLSADLTPYQLPSEIGSAANPATVRVNNTGNFFPAIRNTGIRDAANVQVHYLLDGVEIGTETLTNVKAGVGFAAHGVFSYMFSAPGNYVIRVVADSLNTVCEADENNNAGFYYIRVTDSKPDLEVLSQYISPSSLNPLPAQNITIVGTVRNAGGKLSTANVMRFFVDDIQLGDEVPFNAIEPGKDTTVAATVTYSSLTEGVKIMKIVVDPANTLDEENEYNNEATRALIVGEAPDMAKRLAHSIRFNPNGFVAGDSVTISYDIINNGTVDGSAWVRFHILDHNGGLRAVDSMPFTLAAGANTIVSKKMYFDVLKGKVVAEIVNCTPVEYNMHNNTDTLDFSTVVPLPKNVIVNGNLDMKQGLPDDVPGWIGGKLLLGDYDLTVNGSILNVDSAHFIVTNGTGKLKLVNNNTENVFPVAVDTSKGNFVKITNAGTPDNFSVRVAPYVLQNGNSGDTARTGNVNRTWFIEEQTPGGSNATIQFLWDASHEQPSFDRQQSMAAHYTTAWQLGDPAAALTDTSGRFTKTQGGYTDFSPFTITSINAALPLRLLEFKAAEKAGNAHLNWTTTDEVHTAHFIIEHSRDGRSFETIGKVVSQNSPGTHTYQYIHAQPGEGIHYYRLQMVDIDGTYTYAPVQKIVVAKSIRLGVYPNPAVRNVTITGVQAGGMVQLFSMEGKRVRYWQATGNTLEADLGGLSSGIYILRYQYGGTTQQVKVLKE
ncbi:MAG: choice-of-anchor D domain-containing protein [Chitinophagaceae bacterium]|nr:choice-of-anchor D domain-containing protein [Chitinophagaceae bacterium]MCW5926901.1 choice-of-anchor D domain-containing protein [Chitinophagaceae bacterium]